VGDDRLTGDDGRGGGEQHHRQQRPVRNELEERVVGTGAEALFADLGHFGRRPIQVAWIGLVGPALSVN
jgi:lactam utilization protein B